MLQLSVLSKHCWVLVKHFGGSDESQSTSTCPLSFPLAPSKIKKAKDAYEITLSRLLCNCLYLCARCYLQQNSVQVSERDITHQIT